MSARVFASGIRPISKMLTGIQGLDEITDGGLPRHRSSLVVGGPGSGKTIFALQTLVQGARKQGEAGIFVAFEESPQQIMTNAAAFEWNLPALSKRKLVFIDAQLSPDVVQAGQFDLIGMLDMIAAVAKQNGATRIVFDGIDVLLGLLNDPVVERQEIYRIRDWLRSSKLTAIITQKLDESDSRYQYLQFMVDCVVVLKHHVLDGSAFRSLRVVKYRGSGFSSDEFPITLTDRAMQLTNRGPSELVYRVTDERVSTGLPRLDHMLTGGYHRGSNVLISGAPGTAKSTLCSLFASAACARGERTLYVSFDEGAAQIVRNVRSVGINLAPHLASGVLSMYSTRTRGPNIEDQFGELRERVRSHRARCLVIDPLSALSSKMAHVASADAAQQFIDFLKGEGVTVVNTSLMDGVAVDEATATGISTIADTWIHVSYLVQDGERNRALTIVKSRGTAHSNQVRELKLGRDGVDLTDVFVAQGKVLMGVARWEWEQQERLTKKHLQAATVLKRLQLKLAQAEAAARLQVVQVEIEAREAEIAVHSEATGRETQLRVSDRAMLRKLRHADAEVVLPKGVAAEHTTKKRSPAKKTFAKRSSTKKKSAVQRMKRRAPASGRER